MEWGRHLLDFDMVWDFMRNTPWSNREEKTTIQAYHKLVWKLKCPSVEVDQLYKLLNHLSTNF
jgi:hypothetical protein